MIKNTYNLKSNESAIGTAQMVLIKWKRHWYCSAIKTKENTLKVLKMYWLNISKVSTAIILTNIAFFKHIFTKKRLQKIIWTLKIHKRKKISFLTIVLCRMTQVVLRRKSLSQQKRADFTPKENIIFETTNLTKSKSKNIRK